jgi:N6-L-threonylcarbamoyladenine synthase
MNIIATTMDDSFGESFDKVAKMLGLGYPGGPIVEQYAKKGDQNSYDFPIPLRQSSKIAFSYSGLKNAVRMAIEKESILKDQTKANICASFQEAAVAHILQKTKKYFSNHKIERFAIVGGASANIRLRTQIEQLCDKNGTKLLLAPLQYCSDNAAMIGRVAIEQYKNKDFTNIKDIDIQSKIKGF